jgi:hypothetical protein
MRVSPLAFLGWIKHATCIVTSSFHGVALSVGLAKPFYCVSKSSVPDVRISELLGEMALDHRFVPGGYLPTLSEIDYSPESKTATSLRLLRQESGDFLCKALANIRSVCRVESSICGHPASFR